MCGFGPGGLAGPLLRLVQLMSCKWIGAGIAARMAAMRQDFLDFLDAQYALVVGA